MEGVGDVALDFFVRSLKYVLVYMCQLLKDSKTGGLELHPW